jgi:hypothetical protein
MMAMKQYTFSVENKIIYIYAEKLHTAFHRLGEQIEERKIKRNNLKIELLTIQGLSYADWEKICKICLDKKPNVYCKTYAQRMIGNCSGPSLDQREGAT